MKIPRLLLLPLATLLLLLLGCDLSGGGKGGQDLENAGQENSSAGIVLQCSSQPVAAKPGDATGVPVQILLSGMAPQNLTLRVDNLRGADWKAALCYDTHCFIHSGAGAFVEIVPWVDNAELSIKFIVPPEASPGERLSLRLTVTPDKGSGDSAEIAGYIP